VTDDIRVADLTIMLKRCRMVLENMAEEREGFWNEFIGNRWAINHEPLRADAKSLLPLIDQLLEALDV